MQQGFVVPSAGRGVLLIVFAWLSMLGVDLLVHGGLLAGLYTQPSPFLLSPARAFALIPVGYLSLLLFAVLLVWLMVRVHVAGWWAGGLFGLEVGALAWGAFVFGLLSISTADGALLVGWFVGQTVEMAIAGAVVGAGLAGARLRWLIGFVVGLVVLCAAATIILQSSGVVPATRLPA